MRSIHPTFLTVCLAVLAVGCTSHTDLTKTPDVQRSGILGKAFRTTEPLDLVKVKSSKILQLVKPGYARGELIGPVRADTPLTVVRVVRVSELVAFMGPFPVHRLWNATLARIDAGPHAGREVMVMDEGQTLPGIRSVHDELP